MCLIVGLTSHKKSYQTGLINQESGQNPTVLLRTAVTKAQFAVQASRSDVSIIGGGIWWHSRELDMVFCRLESLETLLVKVVSQGMPRK